MEASEAACLHDETSYYFLNKDFELPSSESLQSEIGSQVSVAAASSTESEPGCTLIPIWELEQLITVDSGFANSVSSQGHSPAFLIFVLLPSKSSSGVTTSCGCLLKVQKYSGELFMQCLTAPNHHKGPKSVCLNKGLEFWKKRAPESLLCTEVKLLRDRTRRIPSLDSYKGKFAPWELEEGCHQGPPDPRVLYPRLHKRTASGIKVTVEPENASVGASESLIPHAELIVQAKSLPNVKYLSKQEKVRILKLLEPSKRLGIPPDRLVKVMQNQAVVYGEHGTCKIVILRETLLSEVDPVTGAASVDCQAPPFKGVELGLFRVSDGEYFDYRILEKYWNDATSKKGNMETAYYDMAKEYGRRLKCEELELLDAAALICGRDGGGSSGINISNEWKAWLKSLGKPPPLRGFGNPNKIQLGPFHMAVHVPSTTLDFLRPSYGYKILRRACHTFLKRHPLSESKLLPRCDVCPLCTPGSKPRGAHNSRGDDGMSALIFDGVSIKFKKDKLHDLSFQRSKIFGIPGDDGRAEANGDGDASDSESESHPEAPMPASRVVPSITQRCLQQRLPDITTPTGWDSVLRSGEYGSALDADVDLCGVKGNPLTKTQFKALQCVLKLHPQASGPGSDSFQVLAENFKTLARSSGVNMSLVLSSFNHPPASVANCKMCLRCFRSRLPLSTRAAECTNF